MDPTSKESTNTFDLNPYIKRQVWLYLTSKYPNIDKTNLELIYNSVLLELTDSTNYDQLNKNLRVEDEEQRLRIINLYLSSLVPKVIDRLATKRNLQAKESITQGVLSDIANSRQSKFDGRSILDAFKGSFSGLPSSGPSNVSSRSAFSQIIETKYKNELVKLGNPSKTSPDFKTITDLALEKTNLFQQRVISEIESSPKYVTFDSKTGTFQDFKTGLINQRLAKLVVTGVIKPHGQEERSRLISSILENDFSFLENLHISSPEFPSIRVIAPKLKALVEEVKKNANGEIQILSDPLEEFNSFTDEITGNSFSKQVESEARNATSLSLSLRLSTMGLELEDPDKQTISDGVTYLDTVIGFSETLKYKNQRSATDIRSELGIKENEFSITEGIQEKGLSSVKEKGFFVSSDVLSSALSFAVNQSANSSRLSSEDKEVLRRLQAQVLAVSGRMGISFETQKELEQYLQAVRTLNPTELFKQFKNYTVSEAVPELENRISILQGKLTLQHSNIFQNNLSEKSRSEQVSLANIVGNKIFNKTMAKLPKFLELKETYDFLKMLKNKGLTSALWSKKIDFLIAASDYAGLREIAELLEKYNRIKIYYHLLQDIRKAIHNSLYRNTLRLKKVVRLLNPIKLGRKSLDYTRKSLRSIKSSYRYIVFLQNDVRRTFSNILNRNSIKHFLSRSKTFSNAALLRFSGVLAILKNRSKIPFAKKIKDLETYAKSGKLFSVFASLNASFLKNLISFLSKNSSILSKNFAQFVSKINLTSLKSFFARIPGFLKSFSNSSVSKATQQAAYRVSRIISQRFMLVAARSTAKFAAGAVTAGLGFLAITAVEYIGIKRALLIIASIIFTIIFIILYFMYLVISTISGSFNSSTSDTSREYNTSYTYGTISGSGVSLSFLGGSLDSNDCAERVQSWGGGTRGTDYWDNLNKRRFSNLRVTSSNCKIVCNMARAIAGLQPSSRAGVKGLNCNPNYYNGVIHTLGPSNPYSGYSGPPFGYYACNYLTYSAYNTRGSVVDSSMTSAYEKWTGRLFHDYCNSTPFESIPGAYGNQTIDQLISNKRTNASCNSSFGDPDTRMRRWLMIPARVQGAGSASICIPRELINPGDVFYDGVAAKGCLYGPNSMNDAVIHTGLVLEVTADKLYTLEANADVKTMTRSIEDCTARLNNQDVPGFTIKDGGRNRYLCRFFKYNLPDPDCPTDGSSYNCPEIISGTEGFMRD